ncbi:MAG: helix-turn-helix domain-containing protein, partial [Roseiflexaceae bacterium]
PLFTDLNGNEIALISMNTLRDVDPPIALATLIDRLAMVPVSAVVIFGVCDDQTIHVAERHQLPLISVTSDVDIRAIERELQRLLSDFDLHVERRAAQIALELGELSLAGDGLARMLALLSSKIDRSLALFSNKGELLAYHGSHEYRVIAQSIALRAGEQRVSGIDVWALQLAAANHPIGTLVLLGVSLTSADRATVKRAGMALALELSKTQALSAVEERYRGNFLEQLFSGLLSDSSILLQRARDAGVDLRKTHVAVLCVLPASQRVVSQSVIPALLPSASSTTSTMPHADGIVCMVPLDAKVVLSPATIATYFQGVLQRYPETQLAYGRAVSSVHEWMMSLQEAEMTGQLLRVMPRQVLGYHEIGIYQLLLPMLKSPDTLLFHRQQLQPLLDYENSADGELLHTLAAYFECNGNLARTAESIHVHRNTLLYRLTRIAQICHVDLEDAETRLSLWVALKLHRLIEVSKHA